MKKKLVPAPIPQGHVPAPFDSNDATAMQALASGTANDGQQKRALDWIIKDACALPLWAYRESQRETDIALGRQFVGQQIMGLLKVNVSTLRKRETDNG
jgi:hypothetical protein